MRDHPGDPDPMLIQQARERIDRKKVSFGWETIAVDDRYTRCQKKLKSIWRRSGSSSQIRAVLQKGSFSTHRNWDYK